MNALPIIMLGLLALGAIVIAFIGRSKTIATATTFTNLVFSILLAIKMRPEVAGYQFATNIPWILWQQLFNIHFHIGLDALNLPLVLLTTIVSWAAICITPHDIKNDRGFFAGLLLISFGALGAFMSVDLFFLFIFHEVALIPTFLLIGMWGNHQRKFAASQITVYLTAGSLILLIGLLAMYHSMPAAHRTFDLEQMHQLFSQIYWDMPTQMTIYGLLLAGFGILISLWPCYSWAPQGYSSAPPSVAMMHAGVLKKFGLYSLIRIAIPLLPHGMAAWSNVLSSLLLLNIIHVGLVTLAQKELGLLLGYSSVMHMGYLFLGLLAANQLGLTGMVLLMVGHGLSVALLFALSGEIRQRTGTLAFKDLGGLAQKAPLISFLFSIGAFASIGLPGLANFAGEILIFFGAWQERPFVTMIALWGVVISSVYMLRAIRSIFYGTLSAASEKATDLKINQLLPYFTLAAGLVVVGFYPQLITNGLSFFWRNL